jgi:23S rRNA pseudouridine955/2504/2580 synthase
MLQLIISPDDTGTRLDKFLRRKLPRTPLSAIYRLIRTGDARINGKKAQQNYRLQPNDIIDLRLDAAEVSDPDKSDDATVKDLAKTEFFKKNFRILFEDEYLIACDKPVHMVVHPGSGHVSHDSLIDCARSYLLQKKSSAIEPFLVHRIDKDTSGLVLIAKNRQVLRELHEALRAHAIRKIYQAVVHGRPPKNQGTVEVDLKKTFERNDGTKMTVDEDGESSKSAYRVIQSNKVCSLVDVEIFTGKTHQIRVHMAHVGCPVIGDVRYGDEQSDLKIFSNKSVQRRLYLHAHRLTFQHPMSRMEISLESPVPASFQTIIKTLV